VTTTQATAEPPLETALYASLTDPRSDLGRVAAAGATTVRLTLSWPSVAPQVEPPSWDPTNPADPNYDWAKFDAVVREAAARGIRIYVTVAGAPKWAQGTPVVDDELAARTPDPVAFGQFAQALASRYSGTFEGLPRIRYFQAWNEPNISLYLVPQLEGGKPVSPAFYRRMLNSFARAVHAVRRDNVVIAGGLAPFRDIAPSVLAQDPDWGPLSFMRALLCVSKSGRPTCSARVDFDIWATHPYTSGGPSHHAVLENDVSLGDLPKMRAVLAAAARAGHLVERRPAFWVTEFSWDSNPPDPKGVPTALLSRWIAQGLHQMWMNGVSLVTWLQVRDEPLNSSYFQSGLWYANGRPKPALRAFRFPFVAWPSAGRVSVWGRTPAGKPGRVVIEQSFGYAWRRVRVVATGSHGVFQAVLTAPQRGRMRAVLLGSSAASVPFGVAPVPDRFFNPFGEPTLLEPKR
jgi:hypothetical protein